MANTCFCPRAPPLGGPIKKSLPVFWVEGVQEGEGLGGSLKYVDRSWLLFGGSSVLDKVVKGSIFGIFKCWWCGDWCDPWNPFLINPFIPFIEMLMASGNPSHFCQKVELISCISIQDELHFYTNSKKKNCFVKVLLLWWLAIGGQSTLICSSRSLLCIYM